jgi:hypothetical protein
MRNSLRWRSDCIINRIMSHAEVVPVVLTLLRQEDDSTTASGALQDLGLDRQISAHTVAQASELLRREPVAVVLTDYLNGAWTELLRVGQALHPKPKIIVGLSFSQIYRGECGAVVELGAHNVLGSPYQAAEVRQVVWWAVEAWLRESRERTAAIERLSHRVTPGRVVRARAAGNRY